MTIHAVVLDQGREEFPIPLDVRLRCRGLQCGTQEKNHCNRLLHFFRASTTRMPRKSECPPLLLKLQDKRKPLWQ